MEESNKSPDNKTSTKKASSRKKSSESVSKKKKRESKEGRIPTPEELEACEKILGKAKIVLTEEQLNLLGEFKKKIKDYERINDHKYFSSDEFYSRWLVARKWDVDKAAEMFINSIKWRAQVNIDELYKSFPESSFFKPIKEYWPTNTEISKTVDGFTVVYERVSKCDPKIMTLYPVEEIVKWHIYEVESNERRRAEQWEKKGYSTGVVFIQDLGSLGLHHIYKPAMDLMGKCEQVDQNNYPESLRKLYVINTPTIFNMIWKVIKSWFDENTLSKFRICTTGYEEELRTIIFPENLLEEFGGTLKFELPSGGSFKDFIKKNNISLKELEEKAKKSKVDVHRSSIFERQVEVKEAGAVLGWEFSVIHHDIGFAVYFQGKDDERKEVVKYDRHKSNESSFVAEEVGTYIFKWDNTYSWTKGKTIKYKILINHEEVPEN